MNTNDSTQNKQDYGMATKAWAKLCHSCGICPYAAKKPGSTFDRVMRWHRTWCPAGIHTPRCMA